MSQYRYYTEKYGDSKEIMTQSLSLSSEPREQLRVAEGRRYAGGSALYPLHHFAHYYGNLTAEGNRIYCGSWFESIVHHGWEGIAAELPLAVAAGV